MRSDGLARNLREARVRLRITQEALAEAAGLSTETVSRIERGVFEPSLSTALALADALGVRIEELLHEGAVGRARDPSLAWPPLVKALANRARVLERRTQRLLLELARRIPGR